MQCINVSNYCLYKKRYLYFYEKFVKLNFLKNIRQYQLERQSVY